MRLLKGYCGIYNLFYSDETKDKENTELENLQEIKEAKGEKVEKWLKVWIIGIEIVLYIASVFSLNLFTAVDLFPATIFSAMILFLLISLISSGLILKNFWLMRGNLSKTVGSKCIILFLLFNFWYAYLNVVFWGGTCLWIHNNSVPGITIGEYYFSTAFMRSISSNTWPAKQAPCQVYATLPDDSGRGVFINFHLNIESCENLQCSPTFQYKEYSSEEDLKEERWISISPIKGEYKSPPSEYIQREIYTVFLNNLLPKTKYIFKINEFSWTHRDYSFSHNNISEFELNDDKEILYSYDTFDPENMTIVQGGDISNDHLAIKMNENTLQNIDFDLLMIGGDIAYDNNVPSCYHVWDYFLNNLYLKRYDTQSNTMRVIPVIYGSGNHDLGVDSYSNAKILHNDHSPILKHLFPQNIFNGTVPNIANRRSYFSHKIGERILILSPDVGYETAIEGNQTKWIEQQLLDFSLTRDPLTKNPQIKLTQYHGPILTAWKQGAEYDEEVIKKGSEHWIPLFDKHNMTIVFENHTHAFKRSKPVKNRIFDPNGTYYLGEGMWGVTKPSGICIEQNKDLHEKVSLDQNLWVLKINESNTIKATAYNNENEVIDELEISF